MGRITRGRGSDRYLEHIRGRYESPSREWSPKEIGQVLKVAKDAYTHPLLRDAVTGIEVLLKDQGSLEDPSSKASKGQLQQAAEARQKPSWEAPEEELRAKRIAARDPVPESPGPPGRAPRGEQTPALPPWQPDLGPDVPTTEVDLEYQASTPAGPRGTGQEIVELGQAFTQMNSLGEQLRQLELSPIPPGSPLAPGEGVQQQADRRVHLNNLSILRDEYQKRKEAMIQHVLKNPKLLTTPQKMQIKSFMEIDLGQNLPEGLDKASAMKQAITSPQDEILYEVMMRMTGRRQGDASEIRGGRVTPSDPGAPTDIRQVGDLAAARGGAVYEPVTKEAELQQQQLAATARGKEISDARAAELAKREIDRENYERAQAEAMAGQTIPPEEVVERLTVTEGVTPPGAKPPSYPYDVTRPRPTPTPGEIERAARESVGTAQEITRRGVEWLPQYTEELLQGNPTFNAASPEGKASLREAVTTLMQRFGGAFDPSTSRPGLSPGIVPQAPGINTDSLISQMRGKHITQAESLAQALGAQLGTANPAGQLALQTMIQNAYGLGGVSWSAEGGTLGFVTPNEAGERLRDAFSQGAKLQSRQMSEEDRILKTARAYQALASARGREQKTDIERQKAPAEAHILWLKGERLAMQNWSDAHDLVKKKSKGKSGPKKQDINKYLEDTKRLVTAKQRLYQSTLVNYQRADTKAQQILNTIDSGAKLPESGSDEWIELFGADRGRYQRLITQAQTDAAAAQQLKQHIVTAAKKRRTQKVTIQEALDSTNPMLDDVTRRARNVLMEKEEALSKRERVKLIKAVADQVAKLPIVAEDEE